jgi:hypothetical protein
VGEILTEDLSFTYFGLFTILQCAGRNLTDVHLYYDRGAGPIEIAAGDGDQLRLAGCVPRGALRVGSHVHHPALCGGQ